MATVTARLQSPSHPNPPSQPHPFPSTSQSHSPFQLRPISPHPHYPHLPPHPQPGSERRYKVDTDKERERAMLERREHERVDRERRGREHERRDVIMRDERERGHEDRPQINASRELPIRDRRELALREEREFKQLNSRVDERERDRDRDSRRPLSPSLLKDVNLPTPISPSDPDSSSPRLHPRDPNSKLPAPPTGHDLMAMFPAPSPHLVHPAGKLPAEAHPSQHRVELSTSGYFQRQERAFFAQAGREIVRVRLEIDSVGVAGDKFSTVPLEKSFTVSPRMHHPHSSPMEAPRYQLPPHPHPHPHPHSLSPGSAGAITPPPGPMEVVRPSLSSDGMEGIEGPDDESWRRPIPYAERRRAGKHTRRVVVRN